MVSNKIKATCDYLSFLYNMNYIISGNMIFIKNQDDTFRINVTDRKRFGVYTLFHKNHVNKNPGWHIQLKAASLYKCLFFGFSHYFHRYNNLWITKEDIDRFIQDIDKYYNK